MSWGLLETCWPCSLEVGGSTHPYSWCWKRTAEALLRSVIFMTLFLGQPGRLLRMPPLPSPDRVQHCFSPPGLCSKTGTLIPISHILLLQDEAGEWEKLMN